MECVFIEDLGKLLTDKSITKTQKYILLCLLCIDVEQESPKTLEVPYRTLADYDVRGHGHVKDNLAQLVTAGYLLEVSFAQREDGYRVTHIQINRSFFTGMCEAKQIMLEEA
jgi:hypothetical protein